MSFLAKEAGKQGKRFAGKVLDEFLTGLAAKGAEKAYNYLTEKKRVVRKKPSSGESEEGPERVPRFTDNTNPVTRLVTEDPERTQKYIKKYGSLALGTASGAVLAGGTAFVKGLNSGEKPRSDYYVGMGSPIDQMAMRQQGAFDQLAMRQQGTAESIDQKLMADLIRTQAHAQLADRKFEHQMALQQHRQDAMTPRNQPMSGGGDLNYVFRQGFDTLSRNYSY